MPNNARSESINDRPYFKSAFSQRRCLIPASGFFEWRAEGKIKQPYYISLKSGEPMAMAGLWESWKAPDGNILRTTCIITTGPNDVMAPIHDRMPVILTPDQWGKWLSGPVESMTGMMAPYSGTDLQAWPVSRRVSKTVEDDPDLIEPIEQPSTNTL